MSILNCACHMRSALAVTLLAFTCLGASAADQGQLVPESFSFRFDRTQLATPAGTDKVYGQLTRDARRACRVIDGGREIWRARVRRECEADLIDKVVAEVKAPELLARHQGTVHFRLARR
jgi:UrcA family protein